MAATATTARTGRIYFDAIVGGLSASFRAPRLRWQNAVSRPRLAAARQHAGWRCCCRLETLPACSISSTRAARRAASRAPTGFGQADAARARSVGSVTTDSLSIKGSFCRVLALLCVDKFPILSRATRATCTCAFSLSLLYYTAFVHHCSVSPCPTRASPPRARPRRAPARRRASPPSSARARSATAWFVLASTSLTPHTHTPHTNANRNTRIFSTLTPP